MDTELLEELKSILRITWNDEDVDLSKLINRAKAYLNDKCGAPLDFTVNGSSRELLFERCRYVYNNAAEEFEKNFHHEISRLILKTALNNRSVVDETTL
ncbi:MAG: hypothetical protein K0S34_94 [Bacillales bacterium]|nr:hypothetical protein [Bacillales bacterium]